jgi:hypothetical protein
VITAAQSTLLREMALGDAQVMTRLLADKDVSVRALNQLQSSLVRIGALVALEAGIPAYQREVNVALAAGGTPDQIIGVLLRIASIVGSTHTMSAAPKLALALGYDVDDALETLERPARRCG